MLWIDHHYNLRKTIIAVITGVDHPTGINYNLEEIRLNFVELFHDEERSKILVELLTNQIDLTEQITMVIANHQHNEKLISDWKTNAKLISSCYGEEHRHRIKNILYVYLDMLLAEINAMIYNHDDLAITRQLSLNQINILTKYLSNNI